MRPEVEIGLKYLLQPWRYPSSRLRKITGTLSLLTGVLCLSGMLIPGTPGNLLINIGVMLLPPNIALMIVSEVRSTRQLRRQERLTKLILQIHKGTVDINTLRPQDQEDVKVEMLRWHYAREQR